MLNSHKRLFLQLTVVAVSIPPPQQWQAEDNLSAPLIDLSSPSPVLEPAMEQSSSPSDVTWPLAPLALPSHSHPLPPVAAQAGVGEHRTPRPGDVHAVTAVSEELVAGGSRAAEGRPGQG